MADMGSKIASIGRKMVMCGVKCGGIQCDQRAGVLPRCLIWESAGRDATGGCAVIGINPGRVKPDEIAYYRSEGARYEAVVRYWNDKIVAHPYYERIHNLLKSFGINGPILWSELAKCQSGPGAKGLPPLKTLRMCTGLFLNQELRMIPVQWPLIGIGAEAYKALAYLYPNRTVIGVPHPTGSYGDTFSRHLPGGQSQAASNSAVREILQASPGQLLWLGGVGRESL